MAKRLIHTQKLATVRCTRDTSARTLSTYDLFACFYCAPCCTFQVLIAYYCCFPGNFDSQRFPNRSKFAYWTRCSLTPHINDGHKYCICHSSRCLTRPHFKRNAAHTEHHFFLIQEYISCTPHLSRIKSSQYLLSRFVHINDACPLQRPVPLLPAPQLPGRGNFLERCVAGSNPVLYILVRPEACTFVLPLPREEPVSM